MKRSKKISSKTQLIILTTTLLKSKSPEHYLLSIKDLLTPQFYYQILEQIKKYPNSRTQLIDGKVKRTLKELNAPNLLTDIDKEFAWAKTIILNNVDEINDFIIASNNFSAALLSGKFTEAEIELNNIEDKFGQSVWLIKNKIAFLQLTEGLEAHKKYVQNIKDNLPPNSLLAFVCHWISIRNEGRITTNKFSSQFESIINTFNPVKQAGLKEYCQYHVLGNEITDPDAFIHVLSIESSRSIIDLYEAFVAFLRIGVISDSEKLSSKTRYILNKSINLFKDQRLSFLHYYIFNEDVSESNTKAIEANELLLSGKYGAALSVATEGLKGVPDDPLLIGLAAYSKAMIINDEEKSKTELLTDDEDKTRIHPINTTIINNLAVVINKGLIGASKELNDLNKLTINFGSFSWASMINLIIRKESEFLLDYQNSYSPILPLKIPYFHPLLLDFLGEEIKNQYYSRVSTLFKDTISFKFYKSINFENDNLPISIGIAEQNYLDAILTYRNKKFQDSIKFGLKLVDTKIGYYLRRGIGFITNSFINLGDIQNACSHIVEFYLIEKNSYPYLPLKRIKNIITPISKDWANISKMIDLSIVLDAYVKHISKDGEDVRRFAFEDFLLANKLNKPSDLKLITNQFDEKKIIYYLKNICTEYNMETSSTFEGGSREVVSERLAVCRLLSDIDKSNFDEYQNEIKGLVRRQIITNRMQEIDQSRIYVDIQNVTSWSLNELEENFERYIAYLKAGLNVSDENVKSKKKSSDYDTKGLLKMTIPDNEARSLLKNMVLEIIEAYLSPDFGLDRFLSTRIRHGQLETHLRKPLEAHKLISKKKFRNGPYMPIEFWLEKTFINGTPLEEDLNYAFSKFSESYDNLIAKLTNEWLQVNRPNKPNGLFVFDISEEGIDDIGTLITIETTLKDFINSIIDMLENSLIFNLVNIRDELNTKAKREAKKLLNDLQEDISTLPFGNTTELRGAINQARTDLQSTFDKVIEWFVPSSTGNSAPYQIEDALMVAEAIIQEGYPNFKVNYNIKENTDLSIHGRLPTLVDIFVNIFENVVKRSGLEIPIADAIISADSTLSNIIIFYIDVSNSLGPEVNIELLHEELKRKKELLEQGDYAEYVAKERNSGLFKIHKSIGDFRAINFSKTGNMDFGIVNNKFSITISIPFRIFSLENEEEEIGKEEEIVKVN